MANWLGESGPLKRKLPHWFWCRPKGAPGPHSVRIPSFLSPSSCLLLVCRRPSRLALTRTTADTRVLIGQRVLSSETPLLPRRQAIALVLPSCEERLVAPVKPSQQSTRDAEFSTCGTRIGHCSMAAISHLSP